MKAFRMYTGPVGVHEVAASLLKAGAQRTYEGTESVYFALPAGSPECQYEAQAFVQTVWPCAGFKVEAPLHVEWPF
jgi:hypothetical protein